MPKVVTTVNLDFDEKEEFVRLYGKAELSNFIRRAIHKALEEKNREASIKNLSAIKEVRTELDQKIAAKESLDYWISYVKAAKELQPLYDLRPKVKDLFVITDGRIKGMQQDI